MNSRYLVLTLLTLSAIFSYGQERLITGVVMNTSTEPLVGATIYFPESDRGTISNYEGQFSLSINSESIFVISYIGFLTDTINITTEDSYSITLSTNNNLGPGLLILDEKYSKEYNYTTVKSPEIQSTPTLSPQEIYNAIPGVHMFAGAPNTNKLIIRGIGSRSPFSTSKIRAYINEVPITSGIGESNLEDINLSFIDKIQITKGPSAPEYGSSLGGVIHYKTIPNIANNIGISNATNFGSFNTLQSNTNYDYNKKGVHFRLNYDRLASDGYRENNEYIRNTISGLGQMISDEDIFSVFVNRTQLKSEIPSFLTNDDYENNPTSAAGNWQSVEGYEDYIRNQVSINHTRELYANWKTSTTGFIHTFSNYERRPFNVLTQNSTSVGARSLITYGLSEQANQWKIGLEYFHEREDLSTYETLEKGAGNILSDNFEKRNFINVFTQGKYTWNRMGITVGLNYNTTFYSLDDRYKSNGDQSGDYSYDPILSPFLSLYYKPQGIALLYANIAHGFAAPTLEETLTPDGLINSNIKAETGWNTEIGLRKSYKGYELDASIYALFASNLLVATFTETDEIVRSNAGQTLHPGLEVSLSKKYFIDNRYKSFIAWSTSYQYAPHIFTDFIDAENDYNGNFIPGNPKHTFAAQISGTIKAFQFKLSNSTVSTMFRDDSNVNEVAGYSLFHFQTSYELWNNRHWSINMSAQINNIFDAQHASMFIINPRSFGGNPPRYLYPGLPRNYFLGIKVGYQL